MGRHRGMYDKTRRKAMKAYVDASFDDKRKIAGVGIFIKDGQKERVFSVWTRAKAINDAELFAIHLASILLQGQGVIYTDSQTAISYINNQIKDKPRTHEQYLNHMQCRYWAKQISRRGIQVEKIKGHVKNFNKHFIGNNLADLLAKGGRSQFYER